MYLCFFSKVDIQVPTDCLDHVRAFDIFSTALLNFNFGHFSDWCPLKNILARSNMQMKIR